MEKMPSYLFLENVKGFDMSDTRRQLLKMLQSSGYCLQVCYQPEFKQSNLERDLLSLITLVFIVFSMLKITSQVDFRFLKKLATAVFNSYNILHLY